MFRVLLTLCPRQALVNIFEHLSDAIGDILSTIEHISACFRHYWKYFGHYWTSLSTFTQDYSKRRRSPPPIWRRPNLPTFETNALHFGARMAKNRPPPNAPPHPFFCCNLGYETRGVINNNYSRLHVWWVPVTKRHCRKIRGIGEKLGGLRGCRKMKGIGEMRGRSGAS